MPTTHRRPMTPTSGRHGVLFDVDGTLVDTAYLHAVCWWEAFRQHGRRVSMPALGRAIGMGSDMLIEHVLGETPVDADDISAAHSVLYRTYWKRLQPLPGARELVAACADRGFPSCSPRRPNRTTWPRCGGCWIVTTT